MKKTEDNTLKGKFNALIIALEREEKESRTIEVKNYFFTVKENIKLWWLKVDSLIKALEADEKRSR